MKPPNLTAVGCLITFVQAGYRATAAHGDGFTPTVSLTEAGYNHTATLLPSGKVLVVGRYEATASAF